MKNLNDYRKLILNMLLVAVVAGMLLLTKSQASKPCGEEPVSKNGLHELKATELISLKFL